ncbi:MAG TPA: hypothetical protein VG819_10960 [Rhizomicrobium sp.]|jgi:hypothetical protein|nr:hypothetical protein [Rhizomicrobium sp.]
MDDARPQGHKLRFGGHSIRLPRSRLGRIALGIGLLIGGMLWFLPVLGLWMLPLGIMVLSIDFHPLRRLRRRFDTRWGRWRRARAARKKSGPGDEPGPKALGNGGVSSREDRGTLQH